MSYWAVYDEKGNLVAEGDEDPKVLAGKSFDFTTKRMVPKADHPKAKPVPRQAKKRVRKDGKSTA